MTIEFKVDTAARCVFGTATEEVDDADVLTYQQALVTHPDHAAGFNMLLDFRGAEGDRVTSEGLKRASYVAQQYATYLEGCRCAVLVSNPLAFGMARVFQAVCGETLEVQVFYDEDQARRWIGLEGEDQSAKARRAGA